MGKKSHHLSTYYDDNTISFEGKANGEATSSVYSFSDSGELIQWSTNWKDSEKAIVEGTVQYDMGKLAELIKSDYEKGYRLDIIYEDGLPVKVVQTCIETNDKA